MTRSSGKEEVRRLLVVEDEPDILRSLLITLEHPLVSITTAATGTDAIARARELRPHAIILDVELPVLDGFEVFEALRDDPAAGEPRVIFLSARAPRGAFKLVRQAGAHACLTKPFDPDEVRRVVLSALEIGATLADPAAAPREKMRRTPRARPAGFRSNGGTSVSSTIDAGLTSQGDPSPERKRLPFVVLIDDDPAQFATVASGVREAIGGDARVVGWRSGLDRVRELAAAPPDLILLGLKLADTDGVTVLRHLKREASLCDVPVVVLTSDADWDRLALALDAGAEAYIPKPVERQLLVSIVKQVFRGSGGSGAASDTEAQGLKPGTVLASRYVIRSLLGAGGMGSVYCVQDRLRDCDVALKVMLPSLLARQRAVERFKREAEITLRLSHPGIVRVFDVGQDRDRWLRFFTMELLRGQTLRHWLEERKRRGEEVPVAAALDITLQLLDALRYAHRTTIHRDLKPENVFLAEGTGLDVKILDFGIAKLQTPGGDPFTSTAIGLGTAYYMAPEQQLDAANVDGRADLYSVSVILYEMLAGKLPIGRFVAPAEVRPSIPRELDALVLRALSCQPSERPQTADAFIEAAREIRRRLETDAVVGAAPG